MTGKALWQKFGDLVDTPFGALMYFMTVLMLVLLYWWYLIDI